MQKPSFSLINKNVHPTRKFTSKKDEIQKMVEKNVFIGGPVTKSINQEFYSYLKGSHKNEMIIDLEQTYKYTQIAFAFVETILKNNGKILFVSTVSTNKQLIKFVAEYMNQPYFIKNWPGGLLTNINYVQYKKNKITKKQEYDTWIERPAAIFLFDETEGVIQEAKHLNIPVIALVSATSKTLDVDYPIPANNYLTSSHIYFLEKLLTLHNKFL